MPDNKNNFASPYVVLPPLEEDAPSKSVSTSSISVHIEPKEAEKSLSDEASDALDEASDENTELAEDDATIKGRMRDWDGIRYESVPVESELFSSYNTPTNDKGAEDKRLRENTTDVPSSFQGEANIQEEKTEENSPSLVSPPQEQDETEAISRITPPSSADAPAATKAHRSATRVINAALIVALAILLALFVRNFLLTPYEIPSGSMLETIQIDDKVMSSNAPYWFSSPQRGDIVTFTDPENPNRTLIKRVIATEGQTIDLHDGKVYIDGEEIEEPYLKDQGTTYPLAEQAEGVEITYPYTVPEGCLWVMGDNRLDSADSRYFGAIERNSLTGKALFRYFPFDRFGAI